MKEAIKTNEKVLGTSLSDTFFIILRHLCVGVCGYLAARGTVLSVLSPFGLSLTGGVGAVFSPAAAVGAVLGYIGQENAFRYAASAISIAAIKLLLSGSFKSELKPVFSALAIALVTVSTGIVTVKQETLSIIFAVTETLVSSAGGYFIAQSYLALSRGTRRFTALELSSFLIALSCVFSGLFSISVADVSVGRVLSVAIILFAARYGGAGLGNGYLARYGVGAGGAFGGAFSSTFGSGFCGLVCCFFVI